MTRHMEFMRRHRWLIPIMYVSIFAVAYLVSEIFL